MPIPRSTTPDRRVPLAVALLGVVVACLGTASIAGVHPPAGVVAVAGP